MCFEPLSDTLVSSQVSHSIPAATAAEYAHTCPSSAAVFFLGHVEVYRYHCEYIWVDLRAYQDIIIAKTNKTADRSSLLGFACKTVVRRRPKCCPPETERQKRPPETPEDTTKRMKRKEKAITKDSLPQRLCALLMPPVCWIRIHSSMRKTPYVGPLCR